MQQATDPWCGQLPLRLAAARCRGHESLFPAIRHIYVKVDAAVAQRGARCLGGGACCKFDLTAHRLYLSVGELALLSERPPPVAAGRGGRLDDGGGWTPPKPLHACPYQLGPRCTARDRRPLGCRVFFCDPALRDFSAEVYETSHRLVRRLHRRFNLPYAYVELTAGLAEVLRRPGAARPLGPGKIAPGQNLKFPRPADKFLR